MHLAELNIAFPKHPIDDPRMADFMDNLEKINNLGASMPGFVWIHKDDTGHAMHMETPWPDGAANLTVWESAEHLEHFVWNTVHKKFYDRKNEWFEPMASHHFVMWWIKEGHLPDLDEAKERLDYLNKHGNSSYAFTWAYPKETKLWQRKRCA